MAINKERIGQIMRATYEKIGGVITPEITADSTNAESVESLIGIQAGLCLSMDGNLHALKGTQLISAEAHAELSALNRKLTKGLQMAIKESVTGKCDDPKCEACNDEWSDTDPKVVH